MNYPKRLKHNIRPTQYSKGCCDTSPDLAAWLGLFCSIKTLWCGYYTNQWWSYIGELYSNYLAKWWQGLTVIKLSRLSLWKYTTATAYKEIVGCLRRERRGGGSEKRGMEWKRKSICRLLFLNVYSYATGIKFWVRFRQSMSRSPCLKSCTATK